MDTHSPEFFYRGPTRLVRLFFFAALAVACMIVDARFHYLDALRQSLTVVIYPLQQIALAPGRINERISEFFTSQYQLRTENTELRQKLLDQSDQVQRTAALEAEIAHLKKVLGLRGEIGHIHVIAEVMHSGRNPFSRKAVIDRGAQDGVRPGQPALDPQGVVGQVTAVYPFSSEVTLITEKNQAVPVMVLRNGLRAVATGNGQDGTLVLPFIPVNADIQNGDTLVTSGIDGIYPQGLPVATVSNIERNAAYVFARITCMPIAGVGSSRYLLVLTPDSNAPARPAVPEAGEPPPPRGRDGKTDRDSARGVHRQRAVTP